jgi:hypothetical protein
MPYSTHGSAKWFVLTFIETTQPVEVPEEFIGAVDEMDDHGIGDI